MEVVPEVYGPARIHPLRAEENAIDESFRAILAGRDQSRFARQQEIEDALVAFRPDLDEADDLLRAWQESVKERYGEHPDWTKILFHVEHLQTALAELEKG
mgnify:FL=1